MVDTLRGNTEQVTESANPPRAPPNRNPGAALSFDAIIHDTYVSLSSSCIRRFL